jgi:hypothetical protein
MDRVQQASYEKDFTILFHTSKGEAFQTLFERLMKNRYPGDFIACKPWGKQGDEKNDGYLPSARTLFQVYGPERMTLAETVKKINEDFAGAKAHWEKYFNRWVFVHNTDRLPPDVIKALADLRIANPEITIEQWSYVELLIEFRGLKQAALESWFGLAFSAEDKAQVGFADLQAVVEHITFAQALPGSTPRPVPPGKIEFNQLSDAVAAFIKIGMEKAPLVESFFAGWRDPLFGERIATAFKTRYGELRDTMPPLHPDRIWGELEATAGLNATKHPREKVAILAVLAWLFGSCDIFEEPPVQEELAS